MNISIMIRLQVAIMALFMPAASTAFAINTATPTIPYGLTSLRSYTALRPSPGASFRNALFASIHEIDGPNNLELASPMKSINKKNAHMPKNHGLHPSIHKAYQFIRSVFPKRQHNKAMPFLVATTIMTSVLFAPLQDAIAAPSGGRMGGSFSGGSSYSSSSSNSYYDDRSYSSKERWTIKGAIENVESVVILTGGINFFFWGSDKLLPDRNTTSALGPGVTVAQISIALDVPNRDSPSSFLSFLHKLSHTANTDSRVGVSDLVNKVSIELLRHKKYIFGADTEYKHFQDEESAQSHFDSKAIEERSKFEKETTNKYGGVDYTSSKDVSGQMESASNTGYSPQATSAVVTLVIAIDGDSTKLPQINNMNDLEKALTGIATDVNVDDCLRSAEILWTPDDKNDVLSKEDVNADYPKLRDV